MLDYLFGDDMENSQIEPSKQTTRQKIYNFFEHPEGFWAWAVQIFILVLIFNLGLGILNLLRNKD